MPRNDDSHDWLGDLRWQGYPHLAPMRDAFTQAGEAEPEEAPPDAKSQSRRGSDVRLAALASENEALRAKIESMTRLAADFERRLSEAGSAYEGAAFESDSARRAGELELARVSGELASLTAELARRDARDASRDAELALERNRRSDAEQALLEARRRLTDLEAELARARGRSSELSGSLGEIRRQADASNERLLQAKALTDQDVALLRQEMREFLAKFHRIQETLGEKA